MPLIWGLASIAMFSVVDTFFISRLGTQALTALGFTLPVVMFCMGVIFGMSVGVSSVISRACGEGDWEKVRRLSTDAMTLTAVIVTSAALLGCLFVEHVFAYMGAGPAILPVIGHYMMTWYAGMPFLALMMIGNSIMRATGDTHTPSRIMMLTAVMNVCLDPLFIFGVGPFPRLGLAGAAATLTTTYVTTCAIAFYILIKRRNQLAPVLVHPDLTAAWKRILHVGVPAIVSNLVSPLSAGIITWMAAGTSVESVAALGIANRIEGPALMILYAISGGISIFAGQNFGAGNFGRIQEAVNVATRYALIWGAFLTGLFWFLAPILPHYFDTNPVVVGNTALYLHIVPISYGALGAMLAANASLNATGKPIPATILIFLRTFGIYVPLAYVAREHWGFAGIVAALSVTNFVIGTASFLWNKRVTQ